MAARSRAVARVHLLPHPGSGAVAYADAVQDVVATLEEPVVVTAGDAELFAVAAARGALAEARGVPSVESVMRLLDKKQLGEAAGQVGLRVPQALEDPPRRWPVVVKPARHHEPGATVTRWEAQVIEGPRELAAAQESAQAVGVRLVVQEHVPGSLTALVLVRDASGTVVGRCQQVADRIWPPRAGVSARARTVPVDGQLAGPAALLMDAVGWVGVAEFQFLVRNGAPPCLIDVNPRIYGSVGLAVAAGVPVPHLAAAVHDGAGVRPVSDARPGVVYQWLQADLRSSWSGSDRWRGVAQALAVCPMAHSAVWDPHDPVPALVSGARFARRALRRAQAAS